MNVHWGNLVWVIEIRRYIVDVNALWCPVRFRRCNRADIQAGPRIRWKATELKD